MFPLNTILAWNINLSWTRNMIITILLLPLGHIPFSLPLALEAIIIIIYPLNTYGILVLHFACGKLFHWVWLVQCRVICIYFASSRITHSWMIWLCIGMVNRWYLNSSAWLMLPPMELHSTSTLGNSPSFITNFLDTYVLFIRYYSSHILNLSL